jgi:hypothetical protein
MVKEVNMGRILIDDIHGKLFRVAVYSMIALSPLAGCLFQSFLYTSAFAGEFTIYSSDGVQKINIPESASPERTQDNYRFVGEKCISNCEKEVSKSQSIDKTPAKEASDSTEKQGQSVTINIYPNESNPDQYIFVPYGRPPRTDRPSDHPKPPLRPSISPRTSGINETPLHK